MPDSSQPHKRTIRSFVIRSGRMTPSQKKFFEAHRKKWALPFNEDCTLYDFTQIYGNNNPVVLEIGFGMGDSLLQMAKNHPEQNFLGIEVHQAGVGRLLRLVDEHDIDNIRVICHDAVEVLKHCIPQHSLQRVNIFFPDPWHKQKHRKRRLIQNDFLTLLHDRISPNGLLHIATDWLPYVEHALKNIKKNGLFSNHLNNTPFVEGAKFGRPGTKFERRGLKLGHEVRDMVFSA